MFSLRNLMPEDIDKLSDEDVQLAIVRKFIEYSDLYHDFFMDQFSHELFVICFENRNNKQPYVIHGAKRARKELKVILEFPGIHKKYLEELENEDIKKRD